jgi:hypothetical protein
MNKQHTVEEAYCAYQEAKQSLETLKGKRDARVKRSEKAKQAVKRFADEAYRVREELRDALDTDSEGEVRAKLEEAERSLAIAEKEANYVAEETAVGSRPQRDDRKVVQAKTVLEQRRGELMQVLSEAELAKLDIPAIGEVLQRAFFAARASQNHSFERWLGSIIFKPWSIEAKGRNITTEVLRDAGLEL